MVKSGKAIYSKLNYIYIPSGRALKMYFLYSLYSLLLYILEVINPNSFSQSSPCIFSILFFVFI